MKVRLLGVALLFVLAGCDELSSHGNSTVSASAATATAEATPSPTVSPEPTPAPLAVQGEGYVALKGRVQCPAGIKLHMENGKPGGVYLMFNESDQAPSAHPHVTMFGDGSQAIYWQDRWPKSALPYRVNIMCGTNAIGTAARDWFTVPQYGESLNVDCTTGEPCIVTEYKP